MLPDLSKLACTVGANGNAKRVRRDEEPNLLTDLPADLKALVVSMVGGGDVATLCDLLDALSRVAPMTEETETKDRENVMAILNELDRVGVIEFPHRNFETESPETLKRFLMKWCADERDNWVSQFVEANLDTVLKIVLPEPPVPQEVYSYDGDFNYWTEEEETYDEWEETIDYWKMDGSSSLHDAVYRALSQGVRSPEELSGVMEQVVRAGRPIESFPSPPYNPCYL
jgi:hypothetical protein